MANHPLWQLTLVRFREFLREPEALIWVFGFPLLLAAGLGLAFRNAPAEVVAIGFVGADRAAFEHAPSLAVESRCSSSAPPRAPSCTTTTTRIRKGETRACARISRCSRAPAEWIP